MFSTALQLSAQRRENNCESQGSRKFLLMSHRCSHLRYNFQRAHTQMFSIKRTVCCFWFNLFLIPKNLNNPFFRGTTAGFYADMNSSLLNAKEGEHIQGFVFSQHFLERWRKSLRFADASTLYATTTPLTTLDQLNVFDCDPSRCSRVQSKEVSSSRWQSPIEVFSRGHPAATMKHVSLIFSLATSRSLALRAASPQ